LLTVQSQVHLQQAAPAISALDWEWLRQKRELVLGVVDEEKAPFEIVYRDGSYKGITADVSSLVAQLLGLNLRLLSYPSREAALRALDQHAVDMVGGEMRPGEGKAVAASTPYITDQVAIFRRATQTRDTPVDLLGMEIAIAAGDGLADQLTARYPDAKFVRFGSADQALGALVLGHVDAYLDGALAAYYSINRSFYGDVKFVRYTDIATQYQYAVGLGDDRLKDLVDRAIAAMGPTLPEIARSWAGSGFIPGSRNIAFTPDERRWIATHPKLRLVLNDDLAPVAFFNSNQTFSGLASDLLEMATFQTGIQFEAISRKGSYPDQIRTIEAGEADIGIMTPTGEREEILRFSEPFSMDPLVLVTKRGASTIGPQGQAVRTLAIARGHTAATLLPASYPYATVVEASSSLDAMNKVYAGQADAAVMALPAARYYISRLFKDELAIGGMVNASPVALSFAVRRSDPELQSILNKTLAILTPYQMSAFANRWKAEPGMSGETWRDYAIIIAQIVVVAALLLLGVLAWVMKLRRQVKAKAKAKQALKDQLEFTKALIDSMPPPICVRDVNGRMLVCNRSYLDTLELQAADVLNKTVLELPAAGFDGASEFHASYMRAIQTGDLVSGVHCVRIRGVDTWIDHWAQPFKDATGVPSGVICGWLDITEHHNLVQEFAAAKDLADAASRAKTTFLATMSHEIRTPMNAIIGVLELALKRADGAPIDRQSIEIAYASAQSLLALIGDILDIARIESGRLSLTPARAGLREQIESVARVFEGLARQKGLRLLLEMDASIETDVLIDAMRFKQVLSNLVGNAINYTHSGDVRVEVRGEVVEPSVLQVDIAVQDTGIGISSDDLKRLFKPFAQAQRQAGSTAGTGLGLVISRSLCEMMGGRLTLDSEPGVGTTVKVSLRLQMLARVEQEALVSQPAPAQPRLLQVLVVDDHAVSRQIMAQQLRFLGHDVEEVSDGHAALDAWRSRPFDVVITDCRMPGMDGAALAAAIRRYEVQRNEDRTLILGVTADAQPEEIERYVQGGMDECLIKPIGLDALGARLAHYLFTAGPSGAAQEGAPAIEPLFDLAPLLEIAGGDSRRHWALLEELIRTNREDMAKMQIRAEQGNLLQVAELAHRIQGAASVLKAVPLVRACAEVERVCHVGSADTKRLEASIQRLHDAVLALEQGLLGQRAQA
jgi:two-component system sensor histidine kinase EvgS